MVLANTITISVLNEDLVAFDFVNIFVAEDDFISSPETIATNIVNVAQVVKVVVGIIGWLATGTKFVTS